MSDDVRQTTTTPRPRRSTATQRRHRMLTLHPEASRSPRCARSRSAAQAFASIPPRAGAWTPPRPPWRACSSHGDTVYGVNTGFGLLARTRIDDARLAELQRALVRSHAAGTGALLDDATVRLILALKAASLARGYSGVRWEVIELLVAIANAGIVPCIPGAGLGGRVGRPGAARAPVAGADRRRRGARRRRTSCRRARRSRRAASHRSSSRRRKDSRSSTARRCRRRSRWPACSPRSARWPAAFVAGALTVDACLGSDTPFDARIHAVRGHRGQVDAAAIYRSLLAGSAIRASHVDCQRVQDPYSLRCQPQVMGACLDQMRSVAATLVDRSQRGLRQSARVRRHRRDPVRRQLPRRAGRVRRRQPGARDRRDRRAVGAAHRAA